MKLNKWISAAAFAVSSLLAPASMAADEPLKVGFVYVGPVGDHGWSYEHDQGRIEMEQHFGGKVSTTFVENVPEGADAERVITQLAKSGHDVIFTTSFGFMNPTIKAAKRFPKVRFEHATGYKRSKNVSTYILRTYEGRYVSGVAAGMTTKTNVIGYIASFPIPEVIRDINAVYLGAKSVNPDVQIKIVWVNTWYDPGKEADAANALMDQGVDIILQHTDSPAPLIAAEKRGMMGIGQASDMSHFAPTAHMFSIRDVWAPHYIRTVEEVMAGSWKPEDYWGGFAEEILQVVSVNPTLPEEVKAAISSSEAKIKSGQFHPFTGPMKDNQGKEVIPAGKTLNDKELASVMWYVEGIDATIPK
ncbi:MULTISPECIES: BMP family ABC transporter substrate-binding protein [unclassified Agarivorans]|uniref:BMP family ABC transporter substrate-binding protein n=1 Tax=unclassified Agarivorans TaxID=2636026 RepID=UPI0026E1B33F|nr:MULTISPECIES: BMP family ABC transporter substrate-binding protein [unclassified Agarivorans]MDO6687069.1 BMP family ABC transporter substrate-binding protein [Agarivorans sp. 3_MG-2023]MDO6713519.1 BMP family ABC transporter substrate-binding protein [Agarivorans sp. 2_MG-2023]